MKFIITVLALSFSVSAFAEKPKDAAGCTQAQVKNNTCIPTRNPNQPAVTEEVLSSIRAAQKRFFDYLRKLGKTDASELSAQEREAFERETGEREARGY